MTLLAGILSALVTLAVGFGLQYLLRWSPWLNFGMSFVYVIALPPLWSVGLIIGVWLSCAFITYQPEKERRKDAPPPINWVKVVLSSCWVFGGFLLTMLFLWRLKNGQLGLVIGQRELLGWIFLIAVEISLYRIIARGTPRMYRVSLGYGIAACNFGLLCLWLYSVSILEKMMILFVLAAASPSLLLYLDHSAPREF